MTTNLARLMGGLGDKNVKVGGADFKTYMIVAFAQMLANQRLIDQLNKDLSDAISKLM